jgi:hypothetical protein
MGVYIMDRKYEQKHQKFKLIAIIALIGPLCVGIASADRVGDVKSVISEKPFLLSLAKNPGMACSHIATNPLREGFTPR